MALLRVAVVGTGFGARIHVPALRASGRFEVTALVGRDRDRTRVAAERAGVPAAFSSLEEALEAVAFDAVTIATPPASHVGLVVAAARAGKHVLCEKPMARSVAEAQTMCEAVRTHGVVGLLGFEFRFHPGREMLRRLVARGELGDPQLLVCADAMPLYVAPYKTPPAWWYDRDAGGGWLGASGSHLLDATRVWLGEVASLTAIVDTLGSGSADDTFAILMRMRSGARVVLSQTAAAFGPRLQAFRLSGSTGAAWLDDEWILWRSDRTGTPQRVDVDADLTAPVLDIPPYSGPFAARELPSSVRLAEAFGDAILGRPSVPGAPAAATFADGLAVQVLADAARDASQTASWVTIHP